MKTCLLLSFFSFFFFFSPFYFIILWAKGIIKWINLISCLESVSLLARLHPNIILSSTFYTAMFYTCVFFFFQSESVLL